MARHQLALLLSLVIALQVPLTAREAEFAEIVRKGDSATLRVSGARPVDLAAKKLIAEFGIAINVEDPFYMNLQDLEEVTPPRAAGSGGRLLAPKFASLALPLDLNADGSLRDVRKVVEELAATANASLPFFYRVDADGAAFTLVATRTRDDRGRSVELNPLLDRQVTIPAAPRTILQHIQLLTEAIGAQTGFHIDCCSSAAQASAWSSSVVSFEARDERARSVLLRLIRNAPAAPRSLHGESGRYSWSMHCQPRESWCSIEVAALPDK